MGKQQEAAFDNARATSEYNRQMAEHGQRVEYNAAQRQNELTSRNLTFSSLNARVLQERDAQTERGDQRQIERRQAQGQITAAAASAGVRGNTIAALMLEQFQAFSRQTTDDAVNTDANVAQVRRQQESTEMNYQSRLNALRDPVAPPSPILRSGPSALGLLAGLGGAASDFLNSSARGSPQNTPRTTPSSTTPALTVIAGAPLVPLGAPSLIGIGSNRAAGAEARQSPPNRPCSRTTCQCRETVGGADGGAGKPPLRGLRGSPRHFSLSYTRTDVARALPTAGSLPVDASTFFILRAESSGAGKTPFGVTHASPSDYLAPLRRARDVFLRPLLCHPPDGCPSPSLPYHGCRRHVWPRRGARRRWQIAANCRSRGGGSEVVTDRG